jgi:hypothetical protein
MPAFHAVVLLGFAEGPKCIVFAESDRFVFACILSLFVGIYYEIFDRVELIVQLDVLTVRCLCIVMLVMAWRSKFIWTMT